MSKVTAGYGEGGCYRYKDETASWTTLRQPAHERTSQDRPAFTFMDFLKEDVDWSIES